MRGVERDAAIAVAALLGLGFMPLTAADDTWDACRDRTEATCVVDGDTIRYRGDRIRIADIDAPELLSPKCASERRLAELATDRLIALLNGGGFHFAPGDDGRDTDRYGRKLRVIVRNADGISLGALLVEEGLARPWEGRRRGWCD